jgi:hypothetical protein
MKMTRFKETQIVKDIQDHANGRKAEDYALRSIQLVSLVFS